MLIRRHSQVSSTSSVEEETEYKRIKKGDSDTNMASLQEIATLLDEKLATMKQEIVQDLSKRFLNKIEMLEKKVQLQEHTINELRKDVDNAKAHSVFNEQYSRRENLKVLGMEESEGENVTEKLLTLFQNTLHVDIHPQEILLAHRLNGGHPHRGIIVKFASRIAREKVIRNRKVLKGSKTVILDDLCRESQALLKTVKDDPRVASAWSWNGKIFGKLKKNNTIVKMTYGEDIGLALND